MLPGSLIPAAPVLSRFTEDLELLCNDKMELNQGGLYLISSYFGLFDVAHHKNLQFFLSMLDLECPMVLGVVLVVQS